MCSRVLDPIRIGVIAPALQRLLSQVDKSDDLVAEDGEQVVSSACDGVEAVEVKGGRGGRELPF